jgi:hypothetical protein
LRRIAHPRLRRPVRARSRSSISRFPLHGHPVGRLRAAWPDVHIHVRGDSGFGVPLMYGVCQELRLSYTFGIGMNSRLRDLSEDLLRRAVAAFEETGEPQRLFVADHYQAGSWSSPRPIVIKAEAHAQGTNRRAVVTNRTGWEVLPQAV